MNSKHNLWKWTGDCVLEVINETNCSVKSVWGALFTSVYDTHDYYILQMNEINVYIYIYTHIHTYIHTRSQHYVLH